MDTIQNDSSSKQKNIDTIQNSKDTARKIIIPFLPDRCILWYYTHRFFKCIIPKQKRMAIAQRMIPFLARFTFFFFF